MWEVEPCYNQNKNDSARRICAEQRSKARRAYFQNSAAMATDRTILDLPPEWAGKVPTSFFLQEAQNILMAASEMSVLLKILGGLGIRLHSLNETEFADRLKRSAEPGQEYSDIDFATFWKHRNRVRDVFESLGYSKRPTTMSTAAAHRQIYFHPKGWFYVDVFWDKLMAANHPVDFRNRLDVDPVSIPLAELLLEKLQIVSFSRKDLLDTVLLLKAHIVSETDEPEAISAGRVSQVLAGDWGFWYTATTNLSGLERHVKAMSELSPQEKIELVSKIDRIRSSVASARKSLRWKARSAIGTRKRWYNPVETEETVGEFGIWRLREQ